MMQEARAALRSYIEENWSATVVAWFGEAFDPPDPPAPWLMVERDAVPSSTSSGYGSAGKRVVQDPGVIIGTLYFPAHAGDDGAYALAEQFGEILRTQRIGPAQTEAPSLGPVDDGDEDGAWIKIAVTIPFTVSYFA
jgi:hypothetical protein